MKTWMWGLLAGAMALVLALRAFEAERSAREALRRLEAAEAEAARQEAERARLKGELEALERDPVYLEMLMRRNLYRAAREE